MDGVEDVYPLAPLQEGILYHCLLEPEAAPYLLQQSFTLDGPLEPAVLAAAFEALVARHGALRTAFSWRRTPRPVQVVFREARLPVQHLDWSRLSAARQEAHLEGFLAADRRRGLDLDRAPLLRLALIRLAPGRLRVLLTSHHAILDAWSEGILFGELTELCRAALLGTQARLPEPRPYAGYLAWLAAQDQGAAEAYWKRCLRGIRSPTPLELPAPISPPDPVAGGRAEARLQLPDSTAAALRALGVRERVTTSTVLLAAWALLLSRYSGRRDVVFGTVVSGRPPDLPGVESMVGLFINSVPVRVTVNPAADLGGWLRDLQQSRLQAGAFEHSPLVQVQGWSELPPGTPLFETMLAFTNQALEPDAPPAAEVALRDTRGDIRLTMPIAVTVAPGPPFEVRLQYDSARF